jgi:DNA-directed RNA polymerase specialized sigma subunit
VTVGKSISQSIGKEEKMADESKKSAEWFDAFRDAAVSVDANPRLRNLLKEAGGVADVEYQPVDRAATDQEIDEGLADSRGRVKAYQASIRGSKVPPIEITKDEVQDLQTLKTKAAAMQTMGAKAVIDRSSIKKPEAVTPAPKSAGQRKELKSIFLK